MLCNHQNVVMAGTAQRSSEELEPDESTTPAPKRFKSSESSEELPVEERSTQSTEISHSSNISLQTEGTSEQEKAAEQLPDAELAGTSKESGEQLIHTIPEVEVIEDSATTSRMTPEEIPGTSEKEQLSTFRQIVMSVTYEDLSLIGNGAYGIVYKAKDRSSGQVVALKRFRVPLTQDGLPMFTLREIAALKALEPYEHPNIVRLLDVCQGEHLQLPSDEQSERPNQGITLWLVFEHVERDLSSYMNSFRNQSPRIIIPPNQVRQIMRDLLNGVDFLHSHRILHRDLKPQNLLVTREGRIKIADFGLAKTYDFEMRLTSVVVTQWYRAPEILLACPYATPVDIWSVGCIFAELCKLEPLFPGTSEGDQLDRIFEVVGTPSQDAWPENVSLSWTAFQYRHPKHFGAIIPDLNEHGLDLIKAMLTFDPHSRITAAQALRHRYFTDNIV